MDQQQQAEDCKGGGNFICRQSSSRWTPTTDQIRILKELYYNNGVRSPTAEQIQRISAQLRQYGKIEGKNVFYWFQNHKARERQKKRYISPTATAADVHMLRSPSSSGKPRMHPGFSASSSSTGVVTIGQMGNCPLTMEKSFRDCSTSSSGSWIGIDRCGFLDKKRTSYGILEEEDEEEGGQIETLPLFPMHGEDINGFFKVKSECGGNWPYRADDGNNGSRASLELSLNTYTARFQ